MRAISTVVDVAVFLLLVSAAVATLALVPGTESEPVTVDDRANVLASSTAEVEYALAGDDRRAHGTVASLLARAAVASTRIEGNELSAHHRGFERRVENATRTALGPANRTSVVARWEPYRGAAVRGTLRVGQEPPRGADVSVATVTVPAPARSVRPREIRARGGGYRAVATATAQATVGAVLPESRVALPSGQKVPATEVTATRFRTLATVTDARVAGPLERGNVSLARRRIVERLAERFERDMRDRFASPAAATRAVRVGRVRLVLRRWDA